MDKKVQHLEQEPFGEKMRDGFFEVAEENLETAEDFKYSDA